jgi:hypothetical protein
VHGRLPYSSNFTLLATVEDGQAAARAVYKPAGGERPLWDFPSGTLCRREVAAYELSHRLGWGLVPPTVLRDGPYGHGALQLYVDHEPEEHYFTLAERHAAALRRVAILDCVMNNADRKSGHILLGQDGHIWAIDHGVCFHARPKLRTVIWAFAGQALPEDVRQDLTRLRAELSQEYSAGSLPELLADDELHALADRVDALLRLGRIPHPRPDQMALPWPLV